MQHKIEVVRDELKNRYAGFKKEHAETFVAKFFKTYEEIIIPEAPKLANGRTDSLSHTGIQGSLFRQHRFFGCENVANTNDKWKNKVLSG